MLQYIDEDSKSKLLSKSKDDSANDNTNVNENSSNSDLNFQKNFNFSFEAAGKVDYTEFMFDSPVEKNHKSQPKLSLDTFEKVVNGLNDLKPTKISLGKKLFEKQQLKDENELLFDKNNLSSDKSEDTLLFDKEFSASIFTNQNSTRNSDKRISPKQMRKAKDCYDEKPIVPFNSNSNEKVNHAFTMDNDQYIINKEDPKSLNLHNKTRIQDTKSCQSLTRPPTPPPRSDKQILSCFNHDESNNYNLNNSDQIDKTSYIEKISSKNLFAISDSNKFELTTNSGQLLLDKNHQTAVNNESQEIMEIFEQINMIQTKLESTKVKKGDEENCMESAEDDSHEMNLINNLYEAQDCKNTLDLYNKIINLSKTRSLKPTHVNCFGLVHEIMDMVARMSSKNLISKSDVNDDLSINERGIDVMSNSFGSNQVNSETTDELCMLLSKLDMKNLLLTHDQIADRCEAEVLERQKINKSLMNEQELHYSSENENTLKDLEDNFQNYDSKQSLDKLNYERASDKLDLENQNNRLSPELSEEGKYLMQKAAHYSVENLKLVNIEKSETPLGATIKNQDGNIVIGRIVNGGAADKSGLLHEEDEILEINNVPVRGKTINDICDMLFNIKGIVSFLIIPNMDYEPVKVDEVDCKKMEAISDQNILHIRALYNYVPLEDIYIPCKELGLGFNKGDILHVISQDDEDWWQAYVDDDKDQSLAGLIPSQSFQERRCSQMQAFIGDSFMNRKKRQTGFCMKAIGKNRRRRMFDSFNDTFSGEILTYERVVLYKPLPTKKRPIVLIGPHSIGRHELRKKLMQTNPSMFEVAIPHTTRSARREEIEGKDYHFLQRHIFEADIKQGRFIEYGEYEKNLYGTSYEAIKRVIENARICVLNLYPQALKTLRDSDLMPYIIYIGPSNLAKLKELKLKMNENYRENDLLDIIDKGREIEETYGHYFDKIIRNADMEKTFHELFETIQQVQNEENWVPMKWLKNLK